MQLLWNCVGHVDREWQELSYFSETFITCPVMNSDSSFTLSYVTSPHMCFIHGYNILFELYFSDIVYQYAFWSSIMTAGN